VAPIIFMRRRLSGRQFLLLKATLTLKIKPYDYEPVRTLRSSSRNLLCEHKTKLVISERAFRHSPAAVWNNLPDNIRDPRLTVDCFISRLKTYVFNSAFSA